MNPNPQSIQHVLVRDIRRWWQHKLTTSLAHPVDGCTLPVDVVLRSCDQSLIGAHKTNLSQFSEAFPRVDAVDSSDDTVDLSEDSETLTLLMQFMHIHRYPDLMDLPASTILSLAYAAEKYLVPPAAVACSYMIL